MKFGKGLIKVIGSGILAIGIISVILCFYSIRPVHVTNKEGNTDYVWVSDSIWVKLTEGISFGRFDSQGYNNLEVVENPDIIVLGSSHMEGTNVLQTENVSYLLSQKLGTEYSVYNMGIAGHHFYKVCQYLPANIELYDEVPKLVIIETSTVELERAKVDQVLTGTVEYTSSNNSGLMGMIQKIPFFRLLYHQIDGGLLDLFMPGTISANAGQEETIDLQETAYQDLFTYLKELETKYGTQILIFYHPKENLLKNGKISFEKGEYLTKFASYSEEYGITFVDLTEKFQIMYEEEHHVPHGFCTGLIASGHLNKYGHAAAADVLYDEILKMEEEGILCK